MKDECWWAQDVFGDESVLKLIMIMVTPVNSLQPTEMYTLNG